MSKYIKYKKIIVNNSLGQEIVVFYSKHYGDEWYSLLTIDGIVKEDGIAYQTLENLIKKTEKNETTISN